MESYAWDPELDTLTLVYRRITYNQPLNDNTKKMESKSSDKHSSIILTGKTQLKPEKKYIP